MEDKINIYLKNLVRSETLAKKLGVSRMLINQLKHKKVLEPVIIDEREFYESVESILKFREYYKKKYPNSIINDLRNELKMTNLVYKSN